jgi:AraC family transcriptional regulator
MPPIWDPAFRPRFYARWGTESAVISARTRRADYGEYRQLLSIKAAWGGTEEYFVDRQRIAVDDDSFLVLNAGRTYASSIQSCEPVHSFSVFFGPGLLEDVRAALLESTETLLESDAQEHSGSLEFSEHLRDHDRLITPVLRHIQQAVDANTAEELWLEEQLHFLVQRLLRLHYRDLERQVHDPSRRRGARKELQRRLAMGVNGLKEISAAARLSPHHFLRVFRAMYGCTPSKFLSRKRTRVALRLMESSSWPLTRIAYHVGFGSRTTLYRHLKAAAP